jgi:hypothetical protein
LNQLVNIAILFETQIISEVRKMKKNLAFILISFALLLAACAPATASIPQAGTQALQQFTGTVEGSNAFIGISTQDNRILAFVCDGTLEQAPTVWGWFSGELSGNSFDLTSEEGLHLTGQLGSNQATGTVQFADGSEHAFTADSAQLPAGLFRLEEGDIISGWIVLANGQFHGGGRMKSDGSFIKITQALLDMGAQNFAAP